MASKAELKEMVDAFREEVGGWKKDDVRIPPKRDRLLLKLLDEIVDALPE